MIVRLVLGTLLAGSLYSAAFGVEHAPAGAPAAKKEASMSKKTKTTILGGGCFWCLESDMKRVQGVTKVESGYAGGTIPNPTYETYNKPPAGGKSHVEVVKVTYDPALISYERLLHVYFQNVDPTDAQGQFCDRGEEYRPIIVTTGKAEFNAAEAKSHEVAKQLKSPVFVEIIDEPTVFWPAEEYHQDYATKNQARYQFYRWRCGRDSRLNELKSGG